MPLYEYRCAKCGKVFEVIQKFSDAPIETHEECGGRVEKLLSAPAFQFKGSGWYVTDYAKGGSSAPKSESKSEGSPEKKSESAPASDSKSELKPAVPAKSD